MEVQGRLSVVEFPGEFPVTRAFPESVLRLPLTSPSLMMTQSQCPRESSIGRETLRESKSHPSTSKMTFLGLTCLCLGHWTGTLPLEE